MKVAQITGPRACALAEKPDPAIRRDYVLLKVEVAPMCNEYVAYRDGVYLERNRPDSLGHEMAGVVADAPEGALLSPGDRVVALCGYPCGTCELCRRGYYSHCATTEDPLEVCKSESGECGFAQYAIKPARLCVPVPDGMPLDHAAMACCGLGPTFGVMRRIGVDSSDTVLITGLGAVGLGGVINARYRGATVIGVARTPYRAELARDLGCAAVLDPRDGDVRERIRALTGGGVDVAIDCSGRPEYQRLCIDAINRLGTVGFLAEPGELTVRVDDDLVQKGATLMGSLDINLADAGPLLRMISRVPDQIERFITHRYPLDRIGEAFERQSRYECGKIVLYPWS
ncbi:zinc-binding dehydrogenase [Nonomuraea sp. MCN248]|uniref:Zinc-binding dehydrogenase n=1 Tax=Nonomuraea corallina TaxID=2989783 RepID=A0ABT4S730_9ACTN|nr:zinc-binding dehydrogenase [Nonomuraea corallina]MDA0632745.1 zinc-binding dehydrogenase [Nonomuraea corallina]